MSPKVKPSTIWPDSHTRLGTALCNTLILLRRTENLMGVSVDDLERQYKSAFFVVNPHISKNLSALKKRGVVVRTGTKGYWRALRLEEARPRMDGLGLKPKYNGPVKPAPRMKDLTTTQVIVYLAQQGITAGPRMLIDMHQNNWVRVGNPAHTGKRGGYRYAAEAVDQVARAFNATRTP